MNKFTTKWNCKEIEKKFREYTMLLNEWASLNPHSLENKSLTTERSFK